MGSAGRRLSSGLIFIGSFRWLARQYASPPMASSTFSNLSSNRKPGQELPAGIFSIVERLVVLLPRDE